MSTVILIGVLLYLLMQIGISAFVARKVRSEKDYWVAGNSLGIFATSVSLFATWFGAETLMGSAGSVAESGLSGSRADPFGYTICLVLMGVFLAYQLRSRNYVTIADFMKHRYGSIVEKLTALIYIPSCIVWSAAQFMAFGLVSSVLMGLPKETAITIGAFMIMTYTIIGGIIGDVVSDIIQAFILIIGLVLILCGVVNIFGGWEATLATIKPSQMTFSAADETIWQKIDAWMIPILGSLVSQEAMSRMFASRSPEIARKSCFWAAGIYIIAGLVPVFVALTGSHLPLAMEHRDMFLPELAKQILHPAVYIIFCGSLMAAILSTVDSTLLSVSSLLCHNVILPQYPQLSEKHKLIIARGSVVIAGIVAYAIAINGKNIYELVQTASSLGSAGILILTMFGLWLTPKFGGILTGIFTVTMGIVGNIIFGESHYNLEMPFITTVICCVFVFFIVGAFETFLMRKWIIEDKKSSTILP